MSGTQAGHTSAVRICKVCGSKLAADAALCPACIFAGDFDQAESQGDPSGHATVAVEIIGALQLQEQIGRGGMGTVYRAQHMRLGRTVAVKFLPEALAAKPEFQARFEREGRALAMLNHSHIVAVHDFGQKDGKSYLVMEYVEGGPLSRAIPMAAPRAIEVTMQICEALAYAHKQGVVHRDIKPANILLDANGRVKVTDFGIARIVKPDEHGWTVTTPDVTVGTPHYMAPEALKGAAPDARMDIYSVGVLLYEMIAGRLPVGNFDPLPGELDAIVCKALAPDPQRRYASADELRQDLLKIAAAPAAERPGGETPKSFILHAEERVWLHAVALVFVIATSVSLWAFLECTRPKVITRAQIEPLIMADLEELPADKVSAYPPGSKISRARFATWPIFTAIATFPIAIVAYGLLRRHWKRSGLSESYPEHPSGMRMVLYWGLTSLILWFVRIGLQEHGYHAVTKYAPIIGGPILVAMLFFIWVAVLNAWRVGRPVYKEAPLWLGLGAGIFPPVYEGIKYLRNWTP